MKLNDTKTHVDCTLCLAEIVVHVIFIFNRCIQFSDIKTNLKQLLKNKKKYIIKCEEFHMCICSTSLSLSECSNMV